MIMEPEHGMKR